MSTTEPDGPYVYQPFGAGREPFATAGRLWGVGGIGGRDALCVKIEGLTKREAETICMALRYMGRQDSVFQELCSHVWMVLDTDNNKCKKCGLIVRDML